MYPNLMATIMIKTGANVPLGEGMWRPRAAIFRALTKKNFDTGCIHGSAVIFEMAKYLFIGK